MQRGLFNSKKSKNEEKLQQKKSTEYALGKSYLDIYNYNVHEAVVDFFRKISTDEDAKPYLELILKELDKHHRAEGVRFLLDYQSLKDWPLRRTWTEFYDRYCMASSRKHAIYSTSLNLTDVENQMFKQLNKEMQNFFNKGIDSRNAFNVVIINNLGLIGTSSKQYTAGNFIEKMIDKMLGLLVFDFSDIKTLIKQRLKELDANQYNKDFEKPEIKAKKEAEKLQRKGKGKEKESVAPITHQSSHSSSSSLPRKLRERVLDEDFFMFESTSSDEKKTPETKKHSSSEEKKSPKR